MRRTLIALLLWLGCTAALPSPALAAPDWMAAPESLKYDVSWGPIPLGTARLGYSPDGDAYALEAHVKDSSMFISLEDTWRAEGVQDKSGWTSRVYTAKQRENDYRADKKVSFRPGKAVYENFIGREPSQTVVLPKGTRDVLSALYNLRAQGLAALEQPRAVPVMGLKRVGLLEMKAAVRAPGEEAGKDTPVWLLEMLFHTQDPRKPRIDRWKIWLADDGRLTPLRIEAKVKLGTFTAILDE